LLFEIQSNADNTVMANFKFVAGLNFDDLMLMILLNKSSVRVKNSDQIIKMARWIQVQ
jgi:hypothetical protein